MTDELVPRRLFHKAHYNILAAQIKQAFPHVDERETSSSYHAQVQGEINILGMFTLSLAERLLEDNDRFDPLKFLDACSPNVDLYPLSELWEVT